MPELSPEITIPSGLRRFTLTMLAGAVLFSLMGYRGGAAVLQIFPAGSRAQDGAVHCKP